MEEYQILLLIEDNTVWKGSGASFHALYDQRQFMTAYCGRVRGDQLGLSQL